MRASQAAIAEGKRVIIAAKNNTGNSTASPADMREHLSYDEVVAAGCGMCNNLLVELLCETLASEINAIKKTVAMRQTPIGCMPEAGGGLTIINALKSGQAQHMYNVSLLDLVIHDGRCAGAVFRHRTTGETTFVFAGAVVLATGGFANYIGRSDNPSVVDGGGIAMAFRHRAALVDPEMAWIHPFGVRGTRQIIAGKLLEYPIITDRHGLPLESLPKDLHDCIRTNSYHHVFTEILSIFLKHLGGGGEIYLDYTHLSAAKFNTLTKMTYGRALAPHLKSRKIPIEPIYHYTLGGLEIDTYARTSIDGLYACGEITGGIHGASRLGGNAMSEALVLGGIAGKYAARQADNVKNVETILQNYRPAIHTLHPLAIPMIKHESGLLELNTRANDVFMKGILYSAIRRRESVGHFCRSDYPEEASRRSHRVTLDAGNMPVVEEI